MSGTGEIVAPANYFTKLWAVLVNPNVPVPTQDVFKHLQTKRNPQMSEVPGAILQKPGAFWSWLANQRNDLETPAQKVAPVIGKVLKTLGTTDARLVRMSGSGATCFALFENHSLASITAAQLAAENPNWWVTDCAIGTT